MMEVRYAGGVGVWMEGWEVEMGEWRWRWGWKHERTADRNMAEEIKKRIWKPSMAMASLLIYAGDWAFFPSPTFRAKCIMIGWFLSLYG